MTDPDAIKPCPKCGGEGGLRESSDGEATWVKCSVCASEGPVHYDAQKAISGWNTRALSPPEQPAGERERIARVISGITAPRDSAGPATRGVWATALEKADAILALLATPAPTEAAIDEITNAWSEFKTGFLAGNRAWPAQSIKAMQALNRLLPGSCVLKAAASWERKS